MEELLLRGELNKRMNRFRRFRPVLFHAGNITVYN